MAAWFSGVRSQAKDLWNNMSTTAKVLVSGILIALVVVGVGYSALSRKPGYATLGTFSPQDAGQIVTKLTEAKIPYQLGGDGLTILVPQDSLRQANFTVQVNGLANGGVVGQEIFNTTSLMTTQFERDVNLKRAIEGELTRAISSMDKVASARVLLAMPKESLFVRDQQEAKATVMVGLKGQQRMSADEVRSIMVTVSGALTGLKPENVFVVDTQSRVLSQGVAVGDSDAALSSTQLEAQQRMSQAYQDQLQRQLEQAAGVGNVAVSVAVTLDYTKQSQEAQTFTQGGANGQPVLLSQQQTKETATTAGTTGGSAAGSSGVPSIGGTGGQGGGSEVEKSGLTQNFQNNSQKTVTQTAPGTTPKSLAVTVLVNSDKVGATEQANIDAVVQSFAKGIAAGVITPAVTVTAVKFNQDLVTAIENGTKAPETPAANQSYLKYVGYGAVAAGLLVVVLLLRGRRGGSMPEPALAGAGGAMTAGAALEMLAAAAGQPGAKMDDKSPAQRMLDLQEKAELLGEDFLAQLGVDPTKQKLRDEVEQLAKDNPDKVASLLKTWIAEE